MLSAGDAREDGKPIMKVADRLPAVRFFECSGQRQEQTMVRRALPDGRLKALREASALQCGHDQTGRRRGRLRCGKHRLRASFEDAIGVRISCINATWRE